MSNAHQTMICQRCGMGFAITANYRAFLARWGAKVLVPMLCPACFSRKGALPKERGTVKWFSSRKRYGFLVTEEGKEVFFHRNQLLEGQGDKPREGQKARFHVRYAVKGPEALNVELVGER